MVGCIMLIQAGFEFSIAPAFEEVRSRAESIYNSCVVSSILLIEGNGNRNFYTLKGFFESFAVEVFVSGVHAVDPAVRLRGRLPYRQRG